MLPKPTTNCWPESNSASLQQTQGASAYGAGNTEPISRTNGTATYRNSPLGLAHEKTNTATTAYTRLPDGEVVGSRTGTSRTYFITDGLDSVVGLYSGAVGGYLGGYSYSPYGETRSTGTNSAVIANPVRYISGYYDAPSGLYKLGARFYDPTTARFTQMDPSGQEANPYAYTSGNPLNEADPSGLKSSPGADLVGAFVDFYGFLDLATAIYNGDSQQTAIELVKIGVGTLTGIACSGIVAGAFTGPIGLAATGLLCVAISEFVANATVGFN